MTKKQQEKIYLRKHISVRVLFIAICLLAILSSIIFLHKVNYQNAPQFWTELISYILSSILTPFLSYLIVREKDKAEISFADRLEQIISQMERFEKSNRGVPNEGSPYLFDDSSAKPGTSYKSDTFLSDDKLNFLLDLGVINKRQYGYLLKKNLKKQN
jgi:hypothetical protein